MIQGMRNDIDSALDKCAQLAELVRIIRDGGENTPHLLYELAVEKCNEISLLISNRCPELCNGNTSSGGAEGERVSDSSCNPSTAPDSSGEKGIAAEGPFSIRFSDLPEPEPLNEILDACAISSGDTDAEKTDNSVGQNPDVEELKIVEIEVEDNGSELYPDDVNADNPTVTDLNSLSGNIATGEEYDGITEGCCDDTVLTESNLNISDNGLNEVPLNTNGNGNIDGSPSDLHVDCEEVNDAVTVNADKKVNCEHEVNTASPDDTGLPTSATAITEIHFGRHNRVKSIREVLSINDLYLFKRELFNNDVKEMNSLFDRLEKTSSLDECERVLNSYVSFVPEDDSPAAEFFERLKNRF